MTRRHLLPVGLLVLAGLLAACSAAASSKPLAASSTTRSTAAPTTVVPHGPPYPLTGLPTTDGSIAHPAVVVKMDNSPWARPQTAINQADIVFELLVEGITRYALVFGSTLPTTVGPVRSARTSDIDLLGGLGRPLLAWSGANPTVTKQVAAAVAQDLLIDASHGANPPEYWRDTTRQAPHNLFTNLPMLLSKFAPGDTRPPQAILPFASADAPLPASATPAPGFTIDFGDGVLVDYAWDASTGGWNRYQVDQLHDRQHSATLDSGGAIVSPPNVVVLFLHYGIAASDPKSPQADSIGEGAGLVFSRGRQIAINWSRAASSAPFVFTTPDGQPFAVPPGRTWVALPQIGSTATVLDAPTASGLLALPH